MVNFLDKWNKAKFNVYESEEKTVLKLITNLSNFIGELTGEVDKKTDNLGDHKGSWQGISKPTLSDEGMRGTVELLNDVTIPLIKAQIDKIKDNHLQLNIRDFGAKCDGVTDDTQAIKLAFEQAKKNNGKTTIDLSFGTICVSEPIQILPLVKIVGQGVYKTTIKAIGNMTSILDIVDERIYNNEFSSFTIDGNNLLNIKGINFNDVKNIVFDENCKFNNILIVNCTDPLIIGSNNRGNSFNNINVEHCVNGILVNGTDNTFSNIIVSSIVNEGIVINGSNNHFNLTKVFYADGDGVVINGNVNKFSGEVQENGRNGIIVSGLMNNVDIISDTNGRLQQSHNIIINGYKNKIYGMCGFNENLSGNISTHLKLGDSVLNDINIMCHGGKQYIFEECISVSNNVILNNKKYLKNLLENATMTLEPVGDGQSMEYINNFYNSPWLINYNKAIYQGSKYKTTIPISGMKFKSFFKADVRGGQLKLFLRFYNNETFLKEFSSEVLNIYHNNDSVIFLDGDIPPSANKVDVIFALDSNTADGYSEVILLDYGFNIF